MEAYRRIEEAETEMAKGEVNHFLFEGDPRRGGQGFDSKLFRIARTLVRAAVERPKPNGERLVEFRDSNRSPLELQLFSAAPIYGDVEELTLTDSLTDLASRLGPEDPLVKQILAGKSPHARALELITGTKLKDISVRHELYDGGAAALKDCSDPMIALATLVDPTARHFRQIGGNSGSPVVNEAGELVGLIFDGNIQSLPGDFAYSDQQSRSVSVDSAAILEALDKMYDAKPLVVELERPANTK